ncbi:methyltransferase domain-containing protein [Tissierella creatinini]|nr:methyltransferase domain-containing protein [Tissierella creatinini]TJX63949.1 methyltransferase domain-containing protein [Soehngenia saccharolytica]
MICKICLEKLSASEYLEHLETNHLPYYEELCESILTLNNLGTPIAEIAEELGVSQKIISENISLMMESEAEYTVSKPINIKEWEPKDFRMEATTVWSFKDRGKWATHSGKYRGNWSPYIPRNLILRYSKEGDTVLDPFLGSGTTLVETKLLKRKGIGIDINPEAIKIAKENLRFNKNLEFEPIIHNHDSRNLSIIEDNSIDLVCAHPPYANIIKYSEDIKGDLSLLDIKEFLVEISSVAKELFRVLKKDKYCAILIGDTRRNKHMVPLGFYVMQEFLKAGFVLKENIIKEQHNCQATGFWYKKSIDYNFLLIAHEYLFVFRKP